MKASKSFQHLCSAALWLGAALAPGLPAYAQSNPGYPDSVYAYDAREVAMLPPYCRYTQAFRDRMPGGNNPDQIKHWESVMGATFQAMHHYCMGLMKTNRAILIERTQQYRHFYLDSSIGEFDYVIKNAPEDFVLLPEILTKKGENLIRLGRGALGIQAFARAIELKPDYWPPYAYMSDYYKNTGDPKKARELLEKALSFSPDAKGLKTRMAELDALKDKRQTAPQTRKPASPQPPNR